MTSACVIVTEQLIQHYYLVTRDEVVRLKRFSKRNLRFLNFFSYFFLLVLQIFLFLMFSYTHSIWTLVIHDIFDITNKCGIMVIWYDYKIEVFVLSIDVFPSSR